MIRGRCSLDLHGYTRPRDLRESLGLASEASRRSQVHHSVKTGERHISENRRLIQLHEVKQVHKSKEQRTFPLKQESKGLKGQTSALKTCFIFTQEL